MNTQQKRQQGTETVAQSTSPKGKNPCRLSNPVCPPTRPREICPRCGWGEFNSVVLESGPIKVKRRLERLEEPIKLGVALRCNNCGAMLVSTAEIKRILKSVAKPKG